MASIVCVSTSPAQTRAIGAAAASVLLAGDVVVLTGDLGAGKTCFVQGAAAEMDVAARVTSPSFVLVREYEGTLPILHVDVYRLSSLQELIDLGYEDVLDPERVVFVEWGDAIGPLLPDERLVVDIRREDDDTRRVTLRGIGASWTRRLDEVRARIPEGAAAP